MASRIAAIVEVCYGHEAAADSMTTVRNVPEGVGGVLRRPSWQCITPHSLIPRHYFADVGAAGLQAETAFQRTERNNIVMVKDAESSRFIAAMALLV